MFGQISATNGGHKFSKGPNVRGKRMLEKEPKFWILKYLGTNQLNTLFSYVAMVKHTTADFCIVSSFRTVVRDKLSIDLGV
jgi:hypothetical protein